MSLQVSSIRGDKVSFFVSYVRPHKSVTARTLARWMQQTLTKAGVNPEIWAPHSVRAAASSHHSTARQLDLGQICRLADWSMASGVYIKFYKRYVWHNNLWIARQCLWHDIFPKTVLFFIFLSFIIYYISFDNIFMRVLYFVHIFEYIFSPFGWGSYWPLEVRDATWPFF